MNWQLVIRPNAEADLRRAWEWYELQRIGLGDELLSEVQVAIQHLRTNPKRHPFYYKQFRRALTHRFHYKIFYHIEDDRIIIFRVLHVKQDHQRHLGG